MTEFTGATPILRVEEMSRAVEFYVETLGFTLADWSADGFGSVARGKCQILLSRQSQGAPGTWVYVEVDDVDALFAELQPRDVEVVQEPTEKPWALEMWVKDPDGHVLRFGSEPRGFDG